MSTPALETVLEFRAELPAPPERVYAALTEARHLERWFCDEAMSDPTEGGMLTLRWRRPQSSSVPFVGHWLVLQPPSSCAFDGGHSGYPGGYAGRVGYELTAQGPGTVLIARHRLPAGPAYEPIAETYRSAWPRALARLTAYLTPRPDERAL